jgi:hypothetical protein
VGPGAGRGTAGDRAWVVCGGVAAGVLGELVFRQGTLFLMHILVRSFPVLLLAFGAAPLPDALVPVSPLALEGVVTAALRGGLWGAVLAVVLRRRWHLPELLFGALFGALALTLADLAFAAALKGVSPLLAGGDHRDWLRVGLANAAWGWGTTLLLLLVGLPRRS